MVWSHLELIFFFFIKSTFGLIRKKIPRLLDRQKEGMVLAVKMPMGENKLRKVIWSQISERARSQA